MDDKQPTPEQVVEFWEWCGFRWSDRTDPKMFYYPPDRWLWETECLIELPPIDLNNLFKYAIPADKRICGVEFDKVFMPAGTKNILLWEVTLFIDEGSPEDVCSELKARDEDPALALFWAIWQVI